MSIKCRGVNKLLVGLRSGDFLFEGDVAGLWDFWRVAAECILFKGSNYFFRVLKLISVKNLEDDLGTSKKKTRFLSFSEMNKWFKSFVYRVLMMIGIY